MCVRRGERVEWVICDSACLEATSGPFKAPYLCAVALCDAFVTIFFLLMDLHHHDGGNFKPLKT